jgi:hypothetical protein
MASRAASGEFTIEVRGYREASRALLNVSKSARKVMLAGLAEAARPVSDDANRLLAQYRGVGRIVPRSAVTGVFIRQSKRKVTGKRPDFGSLQMKRGLLPAAAKGEDGFGNRVEAALGVLILREGL